MIVFHSTVFMPDAGLQDREHGDINEMRQYLLSCVRMGAPVTSIIVHAADRDISALIRAEIERQLNKRQPS